ncbi:PAS domain S-box-containing protein [Halovenus aranensis]|uniref:PAS domain S-box-containing protein n=1 Tax=Halovenus aranensis TaxID=890420 RepID=A0A1G8S864_9EURY|nr:tetratricopeptide repeat protein [Halovenus aranensis]SDJ25361.1 PAS domain S-box-containing protein [Halovenus aranensis]
MDGTPSGDQRSARNATRAEGHDAVDLLADVVFDLDTDGTIIGATGPTEQLLGYEPYEIVGTALSDLLSAGIGDTPSMFESRETLRERLGAGEQLTNLDVRVDVPDAGIVTALASVLVFEDGARCLLQNVSEYDLPEHWRARYAALVRSIDDPLYVLDETGVVEWVNDAMVEYTGYDHEELVGRSIAELTSKDECSGSEQSDLPTIEEITADSFETTFVTRGGETKLCEVNVTTLTDDGTLTGMVGVLRDIRERKRREQDLELLKEVLIRVFRHNVRNELNVVEGHATILDDHVDDTLEDHTAAILETAERLLDHSNKARLLEQVIESDGRYEIQLDRVVERVLASCREAYPAASIEVDVPPEVTVEAHSHIGTAIEELVTNAIEHAPDDTPWVRLWTDETDEFLTLFVEDRSGGLDDHEIDVLREGGESRLEHSSGVGLWLVRWIVESSGAGMVAHRTDDGSLMGIRFSDSQSATGNSRPVTSTRVHASEEPGPERLHGEIVVGRARERQQLEAVYEQLDRTGGQAVLLTGESGFGKSTLVEQFLDGLGERAETPVLGRGRCERDSTQPYQAFRDAMTAFSSVSDIGAILESATDADADNPETVSLRRQSLFADIAAEFRTLGQNQTVVLVLEELQWASQGTIDLLEYLIDEVGQWSPSVLFLCTCQTDCVPATHPARQVIEETTDAGRGTVLELEPFDTGEVEILLGQILDVEDIPSEFVEAVHDHTGGTPLFVAEFGIHLRESSHADGVADPDAVAVPETVESIVRDRVDGLSEPARTVLEVGAVLGRSISFDTLREASPYQETKLVESVDRLVGERLLDRTDGTLRFVHGLVHEETLEAMTEQRRKSLHERAAAAIESVYAGSDESRDGQLGVHYERAGADQKAIECFQRAGDRASRSYAHADAASFYERAIELAREADVDSETLAELHAALADVFRVIGRHEDALDAVEEGLSAVSDETALGCRLLGIKARTATKLSRFESARETALCQRESARAVGNCGYEQDALRQLGAIARVRGNYERARQHLEEGLSLAETAEDEHKTAAIYKELGSVALRRGNYERARATYQRSLEAARDVSDKQLEAACLNNLGSVAYREADYEQARKYDRQSMEIKREIGNRAGVGSALASLGLIAERRGDYEQAREHLEESLDIRQAVGNRKGEAFVYNILGLIARKRGEYKRALECVERSLDIAADIDASLQEVWSLENRGLIRYYRNDNSQARRDLQRALEGANELGNAETAASCLSGLAALTREAGNLDSARELLENAREKHPSNGDPLIRGKLRLEQARLERACGNIDAARSCVEEARETFSSVGVVYWAARARRVRGDIETTAGNPENGCEYWREATQTFEELGTHRDLLATTERLLEHGEDTAAWRDKAREAIDSVPYAIESENDWSSG